MRLPSEQDFPFPFSDDTKNAGRLLHKERKVQLLEGSRDGFWEARIPFFRRHHQIWLQAKGEAPPQSDCTCPHLANTGEGCPHLYALLLTIAEAEEGEDAPLEAPPLAPVYVLSARPGFEIALKEEGPRGLVPLLADGEHIARVVDAKHTKALTLLEKAAGGRRNLLDGGGFAHPKGPWPLPPKLRREAVPALAATGSLRFEDSRGRVVPLVLVRDVTLQLVMACDGALSGFLFGKAQKIRLEDCDLVVADELPLIVAAGRLYAVEAFGAHEWLRYFSTRRTAPLPQGDPHRFLERLEDSGPLPRIQLATAGGPLPLLVAKPTATLDVRRQGTELTGDLGFVYGSRRVVIEDRRELIFDEGRQVRRSRSDERARLLELRGLEGVEEDVSALGRVRIDPRHFEDVSLALLDGGWDVTAPEGPLRRSLAPEFRTRQEGPHWLLEGGVPYQGGGLARVEDLLDSWRRKARFVKLSDGSQGVLPTAWLARVAPLLQLGKSTGNGLQWTRAQALLLDPLLVDGEARDLSRLHEDLRALVAREPVRPPATFEGELRGYQEVGLSWLLHVCHRGLGGLLADDMGLGKTVQVLAALESLRIDPPVAWPARTPSLVVVPLSLLGNWQREARRFTPKLTLAVHHGPNRGTALPDAHVILTTYGTLRQDAALFSAHTFGTVILDEAHAIKNPDSQAARAARELNAPSRISMTGTPVENSLRDLWSQMEFLNPGLLGSERRFLESMSGRDAGSGRALLARALEPLLLRRQKAEVVQDLPEKVEQTLLVPLAPGQNELYAKLRDGLRASLEQRVTADGLPKARLQILEALLRLRQVACHPALVDPKKKELGSGKLEMLLEEIAQVTERGHKALVFSQFTSFLSLVRERLDAEERPYAYLDGATKDRESPVQRFQEDPVCNLFLLSLKAGGHGLNLTAAEYVFILDPWWNPAVEAQAVDRAHRIGQTQRVFAYRLVSEGTVEEHILTLQDRKRALADAILTENSEPLTALSLDELRLLLS